MRFFFILLFFISFSQTILHSRIKLINLFFKIYMLNRSLFHQVNIFMIKMIKIISLHIYKLQEKR